MAFSFYMKIKDEDKSLSKRERKKDEHGRRGIDV
jgi:hypothetical protein